MATVFYRASRLEFRRDVLEPLQPQDRFRVETPAGVFEFSKADFQSVFANVAATASYRQLGRYHYSTLPAKALPFRLSEAPADPPARIASIREPYPVPTVLKGIVEPADYRRWIRVKATAHAKRDRKRWRITLSISAYKQAIHRAACEHDGTDPYTGEALRWDLLRTYNNSESKAGGSAYKRGFRLLPTIDHVDNAPSDAPVFRVLSWEVNAAKNDMTPESFVELCHRVAIHANR